MHRWLRTLFGKSPRQPRRSAKPSESGSRSNVHPAPSTTDDRDWLTWLMEGLAQVPSRQTCNLVTRNPWSSLYCLRCGRGKELQARELGCLYCRRCAQAKVWHLVEAEFRG